MLWLDWKREIPRENGKVGTYEVVDSKDFIKTSSSEGTYNKWIYKQLFCNFTITWRSQVCNVSENVFYSF